MGAGMDEAAGSEKRRYGLFVRRSSGMALKHGDEGVGLHDGLLFWSSRKGEVARPLSDVTGVRLSVAHIARMAISASAPSLFPARSPWSSAAAAPMAFPKPSGTKPIVPS